MFCFSNFSKVRFFVLSLAVLAVSAFAGAGNINFYGQHGFHKTQSAQTLGHGSFGMGMFAEGGGLYDMIEEGKVCAPSYEKTIPPDWKDQCGVLLQTYIGVNGYPFLSVGISEYFDIGISLPVYGEIVTIENDVIGNEDGKDKCKIGDKDCLDNLNSGGWGNLHISAKLRAPFDRIPLDVALVFGGIIATGRTNYYGLWVHDVAFLNINEESDSPIVKDETSAYTNANNMFKFGVALTLDFNRTKIEAPLLIHANYSYRMTLGESGANYPQVQGISAALEWTPLPFVSLMGEYYTDMPSKFPKINETEEDFAGTSTLTFGTSFHFTKKIALQLGVQMLLGYEDKYIDNLIIPVTAEIDGVKRYTTHNSTLVPKYLAFGGLTVKLFQEEEEYEEEEEEYRNPDTDEDGVCDPWVSETGRQREFARICKGIDLCPYEPGELADKGCPIEEAESDVPVIFFTASPDLVQKGQSVTLSWQVTNATEVSIEGLGTVEASGSKKVKPKENTSYTLTAIGEGGTKTSTVEVEIATGPVPTVLFTATPDVVQKGQSVTLKWQATNASEISIEGIGSLEASGQRKVKPTENTSYTITVVGEGGTITSTVDVEVTAGPLPSILFSVNPETIQDGQTATLKWQVTNATEISIEGIGKVQAKGTKQVKPAQSTVYTLTAIGEGGTQTETVEVDVTEPPPAPPIEARVNLQGVTFGSGNATLTSNAKKVLDGVAEQLIQNPKVKIEIQGHTDNQGNAKANQELSERRAKSVVGYLATKGIKMSRMSAVGFGQDVPIADNKTAAGREENRRIEMIRVDD